ncbi:MAG TPA: hypothetical protein VN227_04180 [Methanoregula sp.]|jgi:hypothetical protein|nr:hypothetical protein [Methanoregula sp.]
MIDKANTASMGISNLKDPGKKVPLKLFGYSAIVTTTSYRK